MNKKLLGLILLSTTLGAIAQLLLKTGMNLVGEITLSLNAVTAMFQPLVLLGLITYFLSALTWISVLKKADVSYAYPFAALGYAIVAVLGWLFLNESVNTMRLTGIGIIILGVYIVGKSKKK